MRFYEIAQPMGPKTTGGAGELAQSRRLLAQLQKDFEKKFNRPLPINPGRTRERTRADQQNLYNRAQRGEGGVYMPANPARHPQAEYFHLFAFDSSGIRPEEERWLRTQGWIRPFKLRDPVHYQYVGMVDQTQKPNQDQTVDKKPMFKNLDRGLDQLRSSGQAVWTKFKKNLDQANKNLFK